MEGKKQSSLSSSPASNALRPDTQRATKYELKGTKHWCSHRLCSWRGGFAPLEMMAVGEFLDQPITGFVVYILNITCGALSAKKATKANSWGGIVFLYEGQPTRTRAPGRTTHAHLVVGQSPFGMAAIVRDKYQ